MALHLSFNVAIQRAIQLLVTPKPLASKLHLDYTMYFSTDGVGDSCEIVKAKARCTAGLSCGRITDQHTSKEQ